MSLRSALSVFALLALLSGCGSSTEPPPPLQASALAGVYHVQLISHATFNHLNSCPGVDVDLAAQTYACTSGPWLGLAGGVQLRGDTLALRDTTVSGTAYDGWIFTSFRGSAESSRADWLGPCTMPINSGPIGCYREAGYADWRRP